MPTETRNKTYGADTESELGKNRDTRRNFGLHTPDATPAPEDARIEADKARRQAEQFQGSKPLEPESEVTTQSKPPYDNEADSDIEQTSRHANSQTLGVLGTGQSKKRRTDNESTDESTTAAPNESVMDMSFENLGAGPTAEVTAGVRVPTVKIGEVTEIPSPPTDKTSLPTVGKNSSEAVDDTSSKEATLAEFFSHCTLTENGERVIGHSKHGRGHTFAVMTTDHGCISQSGSELGRRAERAYWAGKFKRDLAALSQEAQKTLEEKNYSGIAFVASSPFKSKLKDSGRQFPSAYAGIFDTTAHGYEVKLVTRTVLRSLIGKTDADTDIANYYVEINQTPPWMVEPLLWVERSEKPAKMPKQGPPTGSNGTSNPETGLDRTGNHVSAAGLLTQLSDDEKRTFIDQFLVLLTKGHLSAST